ncbi:MULTISPECIES: nucleoid-associated protein [Vibrio]|jgi:nucleoid-associated protein|uniref:nucleoid-associated protein n=1 Tax=Vibrio TaxID=662 RepID=UPI0002FCAE7B|nr:nucleoid-associated protein [Vibrio splendidus]PTP53445.1 nucleoid-associated protein [Vibrio splendidus]
MTLSIKSVVIHELVKIQHKKTAKTKLRTSVLSSSDANVIKLVTGVSDLYGKKNNAAQYGVFSSKKSKGTFPKKIDAFTKVPNRGDAEFLTLSTDTMTELERMVEGNSPATGGYILFADYTIDNTEYLLVAMLKDRAGIKITDDLKLEELDHVELNHLHQAARINFDKYNEYQNATAAIQQETNYLSFVSPANNKTAAGYFISALGCSKGTASAAATKTVITEVHSFFRSKNLKTEARAVKGEITDYILSCSEKKVSATLKEIDQIARKFFPANDADTWSDELFSHLNGNKCEVPIEFSPSKTEAKKYKYFKHKTANWSLEFERSSLGIKAGSEIKYDKKAKTLTISNLSAELRTLLENDLSERGIK